MHQKISNTWTLAAMSTLVFLGNFDFTAITLALPTISKTFLSPMSSLQWVLTGYIITSATFIIVNPHVCDIWGRKKIFLIGCSLFMLTSLLSALSYTLTMLIVARFVQGIGYALAFPLIYTFIFDAFPENKRGFAVSILHFTTAIAQAFGPSLSGLIIATFGWQVIFFINLPICFFAIFIVSNFQDTTQEVYKLGEGKFYGLGVCLLGLAALMFTLNQGKILGKQELYLLIISFFCFISVYYLEKKYQINILNWKIFQNKNFVYVNIIRFIVQIAFTEFLFLPAIFMQSILNLSIEQTGLNYLFMTLLFAVTTLIAGKKVDKIGAKIPLIFGVVFILLGSILFSYAFAVREITLLLVAFLFTGLGLGFVFPASLYLCLNSVSKPERSSASSIFLMIALFGCSVGTALSSWIINYHAKITAQNFFQIIKVTPFQHNIIDRLLTGLISISSNKLSFLSSEHLNFLISKASEAFSILMIINVFLLSFSLFITFKIFSHKKKI